MEKRTCDVEVFSRVTGFFRPVQSWNRGKTAEFNDRRRFDQHAGEDQPCCGTQPAIQ